MWHWPPVFRLTFPTQKSYPSCSSRNLHDDQNVGSLDEHLLQWKRECHPFHCYSHSGKTLVLARSPNGRALIATATTAYFLIAVPTPPPSKRIRFSGPKTSFVISEDFRKTPIEADKRAGEGPSAEPSNQSFRIRRRRGRTIAVGYCTVLYD